MFCMKGGSSKEIVILSVVGVVALVFMFSLFFTNFFAEGVITGYQVSEECPGCPGNYDDTNCVIDFDDVALAPERERESLENRINEGDTSCPESGAAEEEDLCQDLIDAAQGSGSPVGSPGGRKAVKDLLDSLVCGDGVNVEIVPNICFECSEAVQDFINEDCPWDCLVADDGICGVGEGGSDCSSCGDGECSADKGEDAWTCSKDCAGEECVGDGCINTDSSCSGWCGDGTCEDAVMLQDDSFCEDIDSCPQDCFPVESNVCGDGKCDFGEICFQDCTTGNSCGNGICEESESVESCAPDCVSVCGDDICWSQEGEDRFSCPRDCCSKDAEGNQDIPSCLAAPIS